MKKTTRGLISVILSLLIAFSLITPSLAAEPKHCTTTIPTVYLSGQGTVLWNVEGYNRDEAFYPFKIPDGYIADAGKELIAPLLKAMASDDWDEYCEKLSEAIIGIVGVVGLDENGNPAPEDHAWHVNPRNSRAILGDRYTIQTLAYPNDGFQFNYDWRTDPIAVAEDLNKFVQDVKAFTGAEKVNLVGRCLGGNIALTYLKMFESDDIEKTVIVSNGFYGFSSIDALFTGNFKFDADSLTRFAEDYLSQENSEDDPAFGLLDVILRLLNQAKALGMPVSLIEKFSDKVFPKVIPEVLLSSYGTMPSFWTFVSDEKYEEAKAFVFAGKEDEYAGLIDKIDTYREEIAPYYGDIIDAANESGNQVSIVSKYGSQIIPIVEDADIMADGYLETVSSSFGATCSTIDGKLSKDYLAAAKENGTDKYISVDKQIDASTCKDPDHTWFVKFVPHMDNPDCLTDIVCSILDYNGDMTVFDDPDLPQFLCFDEKTETVSKLTKENSSNTEKTSIFKNDRLNSLIDLLINFIKTLVYYAQKLLSR